LAWLASIILKYFDYLLHPFYLLIEEKVTLITNKIFFKIFSLLFLFLFFEGCKKKDEAQGPPYSAEVLQMNAMLPSQQRSEAPTYNFGTGTFSWLQNLDQLDGNYFKFIFGGILTAKYVTGSIISAQSFEQSKSLDLRYKIVNGVVVPKDYPTMAMLSSYFQFDTIANNIQAMSGYSMDNINATFGKISIFFEPKIQLESDGSTIESSTKLNAAYVPGAHQFIMFQRSVLENVPLAANLQVVAHEFGHSIWEMSFESGKSPDCDRLKQEYVIRGLNEGFADMMSYTLTGSTDILRNSINFGNAADQRNFSVTSFTYDQITDSTNNICQQSFYCIGTLFSNALFNSQKNLNYDQTSLTGTSSRGAFMTMITNAIKVTKSNMTALPTPNFSDYCMPSNGNSSNSTYNGQILGSFFNALLTQISPPATQSQICTQLVNNFGSVGFPSSYRVGCP
jgi:hypothetical protein